MSPTWKRELLIILGWAALYFGASIASVVYTGIHGVMFLAIFVFGQLMHVAYTMGMQWAKKPTIETK